MKPHEIDHVNLQRLGLIREVYDFVYKKSGTFNGSLGRDLAYLLGAIAKGTKCEFLGVSQIVTILRKLPKKHEVWASITVLS